MDKNNEVWFSEWSENKIGRVLTDRILPISVSVLPHNFTLQRGGNEEVRINVTSNRNTTLTADMLEQDPLPQQVIWVISQHFLARTLSN